MMTRDVLAEIDVFIRHDVVDGVADSAAEMGVGSNIGVVSSNCRIDGDLLNDARLGQGLQCVIDGGTGDGRELLTNRNKYLIGSGMLPRVLQTLENCQPLNSGSESQFSKFVRTFRLSHFGQSITSDNV